MGYRLVRLGDLGEGPLRDYLGDLRLRGLSEATVARRYWELSRAPARMGVTCLLDADSAAVRRWWRSLAGAGMSAGTRGAHLATIRDFYRWAVAEELTMVDPAVRIRAPKKPRPLPRPIDPAPVLAYLGATPWVGEALMLALALLAGLRCAEVAAVRGDDVGTGPDGRRTLRVRGKGGRHRVVGIPGRLADVLAEAGTGWVFPSPRVGPGHLSAQWVSTVGARELRGIGVQATMHQLRHTYATQLYARSGQDLLLVQDQLGHADPSTTSRYARASTPAPGLVENLYAED